MDDFDSFSMFETFRNNDNNDQNSVQYFQNNKLNIGERCSCDIPFDNWIQEDGWYVCPSCGFQLYGNIDTSAEYRYYGTEDSKAVDPTRCGLPIDALLPGSSLSTMISGKNNQLKRLHGWTSIPPKERSLKQVFDIITNACNTMKLNPSVIQMSKVIFFTIRDKQLSRGKNRNSLLSACIYNSCKSMDVKILPQEVCEYFQIQFCDFCNGCKMLSELLENTNFDFEIKPSDWSDYLERFSIHLGFTDHQIREIMKIGIKINELHILKKHTPQSFASGVIYYYVEIKALKHITKDHIIEVCNISKVTIEKIYSKILPWNNVVSNMYS
jgi:transcription initiation factor TFIIIB Brf1 subunit/transcription initiation factor TFIIB